MSSQLPPSSKASRRAQWHQDPLQYGEAISATFLLSDWDKFGLSERVCFHFDRIETLTASTSGGSDEGTSDAVENKVENAQRRLDHNASTSKDGVCGVVSLMECIPKTVKYRRRDVRNSILSFNMLAQQVRQEGAVACFEPSQLPLRLSPGTRVYFAYEVTKVAFCLDASPTLLTTFGNGLGGGQDDACCALDRLEEMVSVFFKSLVVPIIAPWLANPKGWTPILAVTVLAVYPNATGTSDTSILVRDFRVFDTASAERLSQEIAQWALKEVEGEIAHRMGRTGARGIDSWNTPAPSSSLQDIFDAGDVALSLLPSRARPCIVLATDCRSVACESILDLFQDPERVDTPLVVLDLSSSSSHSPEPSDSRILHSSKTNFLTFDPGSSSSFPLYLSDDSESLFGVCQASGGAFFDSELLNEASHILAGKVPDRSSIAADSFFAFKRRALRPNAVQWYTLFSLSPLSPCLHPSWGKLAPPTYIRDRLLLYTGGRQELLTKEPQEQESRLLRASTTSMDISVRSSSHLDRRPAVVIDRTVFSIYVVSPVRVKGLLLMRVKEGYRAKQYGSSTQDPDKVSIQFKLPLEFGTVLHYELSYKALDTQSPFIGVANVKIELSGEKTFIQAVKNDFISNLAPAHQGRHSTIAMRASAKLCKVLRGMRREDCLQAYLCPLSWAEKLSTSDSPFARRLGTLSRLQRHQHFRVDQFDVLCAMPYEQGEEYLILSEFIDFDSGEQELFDSLDKWSTQTIKEKKRYVKRTPSARDDLVAYCVIEVTRSGTTSRIFTITVETFGGSSAVDRLALLSSLKETLSTCKDVLVLPKPMNNYLVGLRDPLSPELKLMQKHKFLESHFHHESWSGGPNQELLALLTKRRNEVGKFWNLASSAVYSLFAKLVIMDDSGRLVTADFNDKVSDSSSSELYQVQYQIAIVSGSIVIDMHVEREQGVFFTRARQTTRVHDLFDRVRVHDQECGRALSSRTSLLSLLDSENLAGDQLFNVQRMLKYASRLSRKLRFFHSGASVANKILEDLTAQAILSNSANIQVRRLPLDEVVLDDIDRGSWFLIQFDGHTMGFAHLASSERQEGATETTPSFMFRELTFFSIGVNDLYCKRDLIADDESEDDHVSEYMCVSEFADAIEESHGQNYSRAAYLALRSNGKGEMVYFDASDFQYAVKHCIFTEFKSIGLVQQHTDGPVARVRESNLLSRTINDALAPVPGNKYCLFYCGDERQAPLEFFDGDSDIDGDEDDSTAATGDRIELEFSDDGMDSTDQYLVESQTDFVSSSHGFSLSSDESETPFRKVASVPPIFVRFLLDDEVVDLSEIVHVGRTGTLKAQVSLFDSAGAHMSNRSLDDFDAVEVPEAHRVVVQRLRSLLDAYVAEELLERFRYYGKSVSRSELKTVKQCMRKARRVLNRDVAVKFYDARSDSMVNPESPSGAETVVEAFPLLCAELQKNESIQLSPTSTTGFFVVDTGEPASALGYWCFVTLKMHSGVVNVKLYHPEGEWRAAETISGILDHIAQTTHRVNQLLLLHSLHRTRMASSYLIPGNDDSDEWKSDEQEGILFSPGSFGCPVKYKTSFPLYDRSVASQVVLSLEVSVLHSFAVSNRRGIFVYKDESDSIFYMKLKEVVGNNGCNSVELLVFGLRHPGPSVTRQLTRLLHRKVHMLAVDALSAVLTKNPHLKWKVSDIRFLRSFQESYRPADDERDLSSYDTVVEYEVPSYLYDPIMLLLLFRQNICGSTFFHRLQGARVDTALPQSTDTEPIATDDWVIIDVDNQVPFDPLEFVLFYNNAPSPLDPEYQPVCTLTSKGAEYSRKAGTGIAIIDVTLTYHDGKTVESLNVGEPPTETWGLPPGDCTSLRLRRVGNELEIDPNRSVPPYRIRVSIADTALDRETLHSWVELTLNQVLVAWVVERHIEQAKLGNIRNPCVDSMNPSVVEGVLPPDEERRFMLDSLEPGFPLLLNMLETGNDLPHPAIEMTLFGGVIKASSVATVALSLLEKCMNGLARKETSKASGTATIIRFSRTQRPTRVGLVWDPLREQAQPMKMDSESILNMQDSPIDCPEYLCIYCFNHYSNDDNESKVSPAAMCFREVMVDDKSEGRKGGDSFVNALLYARERNPSSFSRSLLFVLSVKRNRRTLLTYNWNPNLVKSVTSQLKDINTVQRNAAYNSVHSLQKRCLQVLAPPVTKHDPPASRKMEKSDIAASKDERKGDKFSKVGETAASSGAEGSGRLSSRRTKLPASIRRPKLIGKSVEGSAVQAMAASRARASAMRGNSPFQKSNKAAPSKDAVAAPVPTSQVNSSSSTSDGYSTMDRKQLGGQSNQDQSIEVPASLKRYAATMSLTSVSPFQHTRVIQSIVDRHWRMNPERPLSLATREFLLTRSTHLWSDACAAFGFPERMMNNLSGYFAQWLNMSTPDFRLLQLDAPTPADSPLSPSSTIIVELKIVKQRKLCVVLRTSLRYAVGRTEPKLRCDAWMLMLLNRGTGDVAPVRAKKKRRKPVHRIERHATLFDKKICTFAQTVNVEIQFFNFASFLLERSLQPWKESLSSDEMLLLLKDMSKRYPLERQMEMDDLDYSVHQNPIVLASYENKFIDLYDSNKLFNHLSSNAASHDMVVCDLNGLCLHHSIPVQETRTVCFVTRDPREVGTLQLVMLTRLEGRKMKEYVFRKGNPFGVPLFDAVAIACASAAQDALQSAAINIRRDELWAAFSNQATRRSPTKEEFTELLTMVSSDPLANVDAQLSLILFDPQKEYGLDWREICKAAADDSLFFPHWTFDDENDNGTQNLFYMSAFDEFLYLLVNEDGTLSEAKLLCRDRKTSSEQEHEESTVMAGQAFANYLMHFLWHSSSTM